MSDEDHDQEDEKEHGKCQPPIRQSTNHTKKPDYLKDYIFLAEIESERLLLLINEEPFDFNEAKESKYWILACEDEICSIRKNKTWNLVDLPIGAKVIGLKWVFKIKHNPDGSVNKYKARLVAKGYVQRHGIYFDEVFVR